MSISCLHQAEGRAGSCAWGPGPTAPAPKRPSQIPADGRSKAGVMGLCCHLAGWRASPLLPGLFHGHWRSHQATAPHFTQWKGQVCEALVPGTPPRLSFRVEAGPQFVEQKKFQSTSSKDLYFGSLPVSSGQFAKIMTICGSGAFRRNIRFLSAGKAWLLGT